MFLSDQGVETRTGDPSLIVVSIVQQQFATESRASVGAAGRSLRCDGEKRQSEFR
jgi:hypothetical protein